MNLDENKVEAAVHYLINSAGEAAQAVANRDYLEAWIKTVKATIQAEQTGMSAAASEIVALASPRYLEALQAWRDAIEIAERFKFKRQSADALLRAWQTQQATERAVRI